MTERKKIILYKPFPTPKKHPKKYGVYVKSKSGGIKVIYFGDKKYQHYYDKGKYYSYLNHLDKNRRRLYRIRHKKDNIRDKNMPGYWSWYYLW